MLAAQVAPSGVAEPALDAFGIRPANPVYPFVNGAGMLPP